jgi:8-oxo-dGTP diphosphatase
MKEQVYTIGALFPPDLSRIVLIKKIKPEWQKGKYNLPGGKTKTGETPQECISREFYEETGLVVLPKEWKHIGSIIGTSSKNKYIVDVLTAIIQGDQDINNDTDEKARWFRLGSYSLRTAPLISNLDWLIPFAMNIHEQGNRDKLVFGTFNYEEYD